MNRTTCNKLCIYGKMICLFFKWIRGGDDADVSGGIFGEREIFVLFAHFVIFDNYVMIE